MILLDSQLVKGCLKGKSSCQQLLYDKFKQSMFVLCIRYMPTRQDAEDVLQEGFVKVFRDLHQFDESKGKLKSWMSKIFVNTALQHLRSNIKMCCMVDIDTAYDLYIVNDDDIFSKLSVQELTALISQLPTGYRIVFNMYVVEGFTHQEIAATLNISLNTSKSQLFKAKALLRKQVKNIYTQRCTGYEPKGAQG